MSLNPTQAPSFSKCRPVARPIPRPAPVTSATLPSRLIARKFVFHLIETPPQPYPNDKRRRDFADDIFLKSGICGQETLPLNRTSPTPLGAECGAVWFAPRSAEAVYLFHG